MPQTLSHRSRYPTGWELQRLQTASNAFARSPLTLTPNCWKREIHSSWYSEFLTIATCSPIFSATDTWREKLIFQKKHSNILFSNNSCIHIFPNISIIFSKHHESHAKRPGFYDTRIPRVFQTSEQHYRMANSGIKKLSQICTRIEEHCLYHERTIPITNKHWWRRRGRKWP